MISIYELRLKYICQKSDIINPGYFRDFLFFDTGRSALYFFLKNTIKNPELTTIYVNAYTTDIVHTTIKSLGVKIVPLDIDPVTLKPINKNYCFNEHSVFINTGLFGFPSFSGEIFQAVKNAGGMFVEDSCNSFGSIIDDKEAGTIGDASIFSFRIGKAFSSSGGALKINNPVYFGLSEIYINIHQPTDLISKQSLYRCYLDYFLFEPWILKNISRPVRKFQKKVPLLNSLVKGGVVDTMLEVSNDSISKLGNAQKNFLFTRHSNFPNEKNEKKIVSDKLIAGLQNLPLYVYGNNSENYKGWNFLFFPVLLQKGDPESFIKHMRKYDFDATRFHYFVPEKSFPEISREELSGTYNIVDNLVCIPNTTRLLGKVEKMIKVIETYFQLELWK